MSETAVPTPEGTIRLEQTADGCTVTLTGEHDLAGADALERVLTAARATAASTLVDLSDAAFIDCRILGVLVDHRRACTRAGGGVTLVVPATSVLRSLIELTHADEVFAIVDSRRDVVAPGPVDRTASFTGA